MAGLHTALLLALLGAAPGCFTHPINRAPIVRQPMRTSTDTIIRGQDVTVTVDVSDPDQDHVDITWKVKPGPCLDRDQPANWPKDASPSGDSSPSRFTVSGDQTNTGFCVWALATDEHGARDANNQNFDPSNPANQPPTAHIDLIETADSTTYPLYTTFKLVASGEDPDGDRDPIGTYTWSLVQVPAGSNAMLGGCDAGATDDTVQCFTANTPGEYKVSVKVSSRAPFQATDDESQPYTKTFKVLDDAPPCIADTTPQYTANMVLVGNTPQYTTTMVPLDSDRLYTFSVDTVNDDGDPSPRPPNAEFPIVTWSYGKKGEALNVLNGNIDFFKVPRYFPLDVTVIRAEVVDRRQQTRDRLQTCDLDFCEENPGSRCFQRVTWTVLWK